MSDSAYSTINMSTFPGEMRLRGKTLIAQAKNVDYQDIPRDIQVMRQQTYKKEVKEGEFVPEFSKTRRGAWTKEFSDFNGISNIGLLFVLAIVGGAFVYHKFFKKPSVTLRKRKRK